MSTEPEGDRTRLRSHLGLVPAVTMTTIGVVANTIPESSAHQTLLAARAVQVALLVVAGAVSGIPGIALGSHDGARERSQELEELIGVVAERRQDASLLAVGDHLDLGAHRFTGRRVLVAVHEAVAAEPVDRGIDRFLGPATCA